MDELLEILQELKPDVDFTAQNNLVTDGILDSFDVVTLVTELNNTFDIEITASDMVFENFDSVSAIMALVERLQEE